MVRDLFDDVSSDGSDEIVEIVFRINIFAAGRKPKAQVVGALRIFADGLEDETKYDLRLRIKNLK